MMATPYLTAREAMAYLKVNTHAGLYRLIREHRLPFCRRGRQYLFHRDELDAWLRGFSSEIEMARSRKRA